MVDNLQKLSWGFQLELNKKGSPIAKRIFETVAEMDAYLSDIYDSAVAGIIVTVVGDTPENNGAYLVGQAPHLDNPGLQVIRTKLATGEIKQISIAEDSKDLAYIEDDQLHITDMRSRWESKF